MNAGRDLCSRQRNLTQSTERSLRLGNWQGRNESLKVCHIQRHNPSHLSLKPEIYYLQVRDSCYSRLTILLQARAELQLQAHWAVHALVELLSLLVIEV